MKLRRKQALSPSLRKGQPVKVIGLGGVGSIVARYGAVFLASLGRDVNLFLVDGDRFEVSNASRMLFGSYGNKAAVVARELAPRFRKTRLSLLPVKEYVDPSNIRKLIRSGDIVLLCVDNHATRKLVGDHCARLRNICLISGGNDGIGRDTSGAFRRGTYGNAQLFLRQKGRKLTPLLSQYHPEIAQPMDKLPGELNCTELVLSVPQILFANLAVASAMLNTLLLRLSRASHYAELSFDIADGLMRPTIKL